MNRRFLTLLVLLIVGLAVWFTSRWWLPWLLDQLPRIEANSDLIQAIEALVNIAWLLFSAVIGYLLWLSRPGAKPQPDRDLQDAILTPVSVARLLEMLGKGANLNWIDRGAVRVADLRLYGRVVITGRSGLGKTREAIELIRRAVDDDLVLPDRIFRPGPALRFVAPEAIASQLARSFDPHLSALLFVDDLPYHFTGEGLIRLARLIDALSQGKALFIVATARSDQLTPEHDGWLEQQRFHAHSLSDLAADGIARLVDSAAGLFSLQVPDEARDAFAEHSDGTPQHPLIALRLLSQQGRERISADDARSALSDSAVQAWAETRRYITDPRRAPAAAYILDALAHFHVARLTAYRSLVIPYAAHLARTAHAPRRLGSRHTLEQALNYLGKFDIRPVDRIIIYRDEIAASAPAEDNALDQLAAFVTGYRRILHRHGLRLSRSRLFATTADEHRAIASGLADRFQEREQQVRAIDFQELALAVSPQSVFYYNRSRALLRQGEMEAALSDLDQALSLSPKDAYLHNSMGIVYRALGRQEEAIAAYQQAIALDAKFASPHNGLGNVYSDLGRHEEAIAAYQQAIALDVKLAYPHNGLGNVYSDLGRHEEAIAAYQQAIALDAKDASHYIGLGTVYRGVGRHAEALTVLQKAAVLDVHEVMAKVSLAAIYREHGDSDAYQQQIALARPLIAQEGEYNRACFASVCGDVDEALALLEVELAKAPGYRISAQRDPDFDFIRDDPRFRALTEA